jgi:flavocytochrome c
MNKKPLIILFISIAIGLGIIYVNKYHPEFVNLIKNKAKSFYNQFLQILTDLLTVEDDRPRRKRRRHKKKKNPPKTNKKKDIKKQQQKKPEIKNKNINKQQDIKKNENVKNNKNFKQPEKKTTTKDKTNNIKSTPLSHIKKNDTSSKDNKFIQISDKNKTNKIDLRNIKEIELLDNYDIIIVGSGLAGVSATYESYLNSNGKLKILLLEKEKNFGGNSIKATSGINILNSPLQKRQNISDSFELFYNDTIKSGKGKSNPELVKILVNESIPVFNFFNEVKANLVKLGILGGHSVPRTCTSNNSTIGYHLTSLLFNQINKLPNVTFSPNSTVIDLLYNKENNTVNGVKVNINNKEKIIKSKTVILTCGGFGHDFESKDSLLKEFAPNLLNFPTTNGIQTTGSGIKIVRKIGGDLIHMDKIQLHPTGFVDFSNRFSKNKILAPELLRGVGGILINQKGERFCNELGTRDYVTQKIINNCQKIKNKNNIEQIECYLILNENSSVKFGPNFKFYLNKGLFKKYNNFKHFAKQNKLNFKNLERTFKIYNDFANKKKQDQFGKKFYPEKFNLNQHFYVAVISPVIHYCMGGIKINNETEVLSKDKIIKGLYAAGEVTGGVHGENRLGGNSLLECVVFGRKAARNSIKYIQLKKN